MCKISIQDSHYFRLQKKMTNQNIFQVLYGVHCLSFFSNLQYSDFLLRFCTMIDFDINYALKCFPNFSKSVKNIVFFSKTELRPCSSAFETPYCFAPFKFEISHMGKKFIREFQLTIRILKAFLCSWNKLESSKLNIITEK